VPKGTHTRTWSVPTSPRSPYKLIEELRLLQENGFEGRAWDRDAQIRYSRLLAAADFFEGNVSESHPDFSARDRVNRAPRTFGFVRLSRQRGLQITDAGRALLGSATLTDLFLHQLLKWQYPSPNHHKRDYRDLFCIRPFLEVLRLIRDLDGLSKAELAMFGVPFIDYHEYGGVRDHIVSFRAQYPRHAGAIARGTYVARSARLMFETYYAEDIASGRIGARETGGLAPTVDAMLRTKIRNAADYADAAVRYFRATGLFTISARASRLDVLAERRDEVDEILATFSPEPVEFATDDDFYTWLGDPKQPRLPSDDTATLRSQITTLYDTLDKETQDQFAESLQVRLEGRSAVELKGDYALLREVAAAGAVRTTERAFAGREERLDEIIDLFDRIRRATAEVVDRPLYFEWNTWRAMVVLDDGEIRHNFSVDQRGEPLNPAQGRVSDIECEYVDACHVLVEVTLSSGARQHATEGEPVARHVGLYQAQVVDRGDMRSVYGLFVAPTVNPTVLTDFWNLQNAPRPAAAFRGHVRVIPLPLAVFIDMLNAARGRFPVTAIDIQHFCEEASRLATTAVDEREWSLALGELARHWLDRPTGAAQTVAR
jgi:AlwI restriction endonuclease